MELAVDSLRKFTITLSIVITLFSEIGLGDVGRYVDRVIDGDTVVLSDSTRVRLSGIDAPEKKQPFGLESTKCLSELVQRQGVEIRIDGVDFYQRSLGTFFYNGVDLNEVMVARGCAWAYGKTYHSSESEAKELKRGLWVSPSPVEPKVWRKQQKSK